MTLRPEGAGTAAAPETPPRLRFALVLVCLAVGMATLDLTVVNVAVPSIKASLAASDGTAAWISAGFSLVTALVLIPAGRLGDRWGHLFVFFAGLVVFGLGSLWTGLSPDETQISIARVVQGIGAGMIFPSAGALLQLMFEGAARGRALGVYGSVLGASAAFGGLMAGVVIWIAGPDLGWRWLFFINVPVAAFCAIAALFVIPRHERHRHVGFDWLGLVLLTLALLSILIPVLEGRALGWPLWAWALIVAGVLVIIGFALWERRVAGRGRTPLIPPALFKHWSFTGGIAIAFLYFAAFTSNFFGLSIYWQAVLHKSALDMSLTATPFAIGAIVGAAISPRISARLGPRAMYPGAAMLAAGIGTVWLLITFVPGDGVNGFMTLVPMLVAGLGNGIFMTPNFQYVIATVEPAVAGGANGLLTMMQRFGSAVGVTVVGSLLYGVNAQLALGVSCLCGIAAFLLVFALPNKGPRP